MPAAAQRSLMSPGCQRFTLRDWSRTISIMDSTGLVPITVFNNEPVTPSDQVRYSAGSGDSASWGSARSPRSCWFSEESGTGGIDVDGQSLALSTVDMHRGELTSSDSIENGLASHTECLCSLVETDPPARHLARDARAQSGVDHDPPWSARSDLLADDEPVRQPSIERRTGSAEQILGLGDTHHLVIMTRACDSPFALAVKGRPVAVVRSWRASMRATVASA